MRVTAERVLEIAKGGEGRHVVMKACRDAVPRSASYSSERIVRIVADRFITRVIN
ncbi:MAG: hypothetical protein HDS15_05145 [Bacteroides sp.]|nr:hypothetical protein [Bacteroides sp.]